MTTRPFRQVDVFTAVPYHGNPVATVFEADGLSTDEMQRFANWTNLSETTFILEPTEAGADYRVRIFTPSVELPFAGHPTIGTCHAWLESGAVPHSNHLVVQECGIGLVSLRRSGGRLAFAAPPLIRSGDVDEADLARVCRVLRVDRSAIVAAQWADNGPGWIAVMLADADAVLALDPDFGAEDSYDVGVVGPHPIGIVGPTKIRIVGASSADGGTREHAGGTVASQPAIEVRAFFRAGGAAAEDPVTGSLNAALAQWLLGAGILESPYIASQGTALGRSGRVFIDEADGEIWVGGDAVTCIAGTVEL